MSEKKAFINAMPTKELFINILTRDISVENCILDLVDNSVDSYIRKKIKERREIKIIISPEKFEIYDNCGGIDQKFLKEQVFRFGVEELSRDHATLGVYGIGLKRSIFKLGNLLEMKTDDGRELSKIKLKIDEWKKERNKWTFPFQFTKSKLSGDNKPFTKIIINDLHDFIKKKFELTSFINNLIDSISVTYSLIIRNNINISVNNRSIDPYPLDFTYDDRYKPSRIEEEFDDIKVDIICGMNPRRSRAEKIERKGWNIFFNDRLIVKDDTTVITGWRGEKTSLPKYHSIFNEFKGIVFIKSKDPSKLPLNTSKNGFNVDTAIYQNILDLMIKQAKPIISYLMKKYDSEKNNLDEIEKDVEETIEESEKEKRRPIENIRVGSNFDAPQRSKPKEPIITISYQKQKKIVEKLKKILDVRTAKDVGSITFDYYITMEGVDDE